VVHFLKKGTLIKLKSQIKKDEINVVKQVAWEWQRNSL